MNAQEPVEPSTPAVDPDDVSTLADHEAAFGPNRSVPDATGADRASDDTPAVDEPAVDERDDKGRFKHRAQSQRATPEDVPQINTLTKILREKEAELSRLKPEALTGSPRLRALQRQIKAIEHELTDLAPKPPVVEARPMPVAPVRDTAPVSAKPNWKAFEDKIGDGYATWGDAQDAYIDARDAWKEQTATTKREQEAAETAQATIAQQWRETLSNHTARITAFAATTPDFQAVAGPVMDRFLPGPLLRAIVEHDKSAQLVYALGQHPDALDELHLLTAGKAATDDFVALVQRRLEKLTLQAVPTGSAASPRFPTTPRPPNPVRTGPMTTGDDLPGDESTLAEHEKAFGRRRR